MRAAQTSIKMPQQGGIYSAVHDAECIPEGRMDIQHMHHIHHRRRRYRHYYKNSNERDFSFVLKRFETFLGSTLHFPSRSLT